MKSVYRGRKEVGCKTVVRWKGRDYYGGYFSDEKFGSPESAEETAARVRNKIEREVGKRRSEQPVYSQPVKHYKGLRMAVPQGVCYAERAFKGRDGEGRIERTFYAYYNRPKPAPRLYATFSVETFGLRMALTMAIEARRQMEKSATREDRLAQAVPKKRRRA